MRRLLTASALIVLACHNAGPGRNVVGARLTGVVERLADSVVTSLTISNELKRAHEVEFAPCPPRNTVKLTLVSGIAAGAYHGTWDYATMDSVRQLRRDFTRPGCTSFSLVSTLPAGARVRSRFIAFSVMDVLDDSLPDGRYAVWLFPRIAGRDPAGIPAGEIELRRR